MRVTVNDAAQALGGTVHGDGTQPLSGMASLTDAKPGDISFFANPKYAPCLLTTKATAVLVAAHEPSASVTQIVVANPDYAFARIVEAFGPKPVPPPVGIHPTAIIGERVTLGANLAIGPYAVVAAGAVIGDGTVLYPHTYVGDSARIGAGCVLHPQVTVRERCVVGDRVILHAGVVVGSDGFGYATIEGVHHKIPQVGIVVIEDDVEIGSNTTLDRARFGRTRVGKGSKIDNLVQIAHNVEIGTNSIVVAQVGIAGSTKVGNNVILSGQAAIAGHITIGDGAIVTGRAGVSKSIPPKLVVRGTPAQDIKTAQAQEVAVRRLPGTQLAVKELLTRVEELERRLAALTAAGKTAP
jgi:UDP-3-O-[3-hydroxymyristoyl] glucosamine N-acyltransferase